MVAVGLWAAQRNGNAIWLIPLTFVSVMGSVLGVSAIDFPFLEQGIIASVLILGVFITAAVRLPLIASTVIVGLFALFHGHAHGAEMPNTVSGLTYAIGFITGTSFLHLAGIGLWISIQRLNNATLLRYAGGAITACGVALCFA